MGEISGLTNKVSILSTLRNWRKNHLLFIYSELVEYSSLPLMWRVTEGRHRYRWTHQIRMNCRETYYMYIYIYIYIRTYTTNIYIYTYIHLRTNSLWRGFSIRSLESLSVSLGLRQVHGPQTPFSCRGELVGVHQDSTLLNGKINPTKDWQVLSLGAGFLQFFRVVSSDYGKPRLFSYHFGLWKLTRNGSCGLLKQPG